MSTFHTSSWQLPDFPSSSPSPWNTRYVGLEKEKKKKETSHIATIATPGVYLAHTDLLDYSHKRSKSAKALSLLHRTVSKHEPRDDNSTNNGNTSPTSTTASSSLFPDSSQPNRHSSLSLTKTRSDRKSAAGDNSAATMESTTSDAAASIPVTEPGSASKNSNSPENSATSIEQSVKAFRLFEILRSGDTTAISKAVKEAKEQSAGGAVSPGTTILHLAIQCADLQVVEFVVASGPDVDINARDREGNTPLHIASQLGRDSVVQALLAHPQIDDSIANYRGQTALDLARTPEIFEKLQLARSVFIDGKAKQIQDMVVRADYDGLEKLLEEPRVQGNIDVNALELVTDTVTAQSGGTLLHEGARKKDTKLIQILLLHGADPFRRDKKGKLPQDVTKDDKTRAIVKKSPAAIIAQRGIQERAILGNTPSQSSANRAVSTEVTLAGKDAREMKGYLKKWTNYTSGFKLRWFVLEDGVLSYYKHQG